MSVPGAPLSVPDAGPWAAGQRCPLTFFCLARSGRIVFTRFRLLITSVLSEMGRGRPWSLRKRPQALQSTAPVSSRRHSGVVCVVQFWQVGCVVVRSWLAMVAMSSSCDGPRGGRVHDVNGGFERLDVTIRDDKWRMGNR